MKSKLIIIVSTVILFVILVVVINPFKKKEGTSGTREGGAPNVPKGRIIKQPDLDVWEEESKSDIPTDEKRYVGERSKLRNSDKSIYYWQKEDGQVGTANGLNTLKKNQISGQNIQSGCYITKDYTNEFDIYKLAENAPILSHFYNQQIEDQLKRDNVSKTTVIPESKNRDYEFEIDKSNEQKYKKDQEAKQNPFFCMNVTKDKDTGEINTDGCTKIEWDQNAWQDGLYNKNNKGEAFPVLGKDFYYVGTDIYRSKEDISEGKGVCKKWDKSTNKYKGVACDNIVGKILENMMTEHQIQTKESGPSCIIDKKTVNMWHKADVKGGNKESLPSFAKEGKQKIFKSFNVDKDLPKIKMEGVNFTLKAKRFTSYVETSKDEKDFGRILQLYGKESNLYKPYSYESKEDQNDKNLQNEAVTLVYSNTGEQKFSPKLDFIEKQDDYGKSFHMTDVGYEITNSKNPEDNHNGEGHLTAFYPTSIDKLGNFKIGKLSGDSFAFVNKSFGNWNQKPGSKEVNSVFWRKIPTYMGKPIIHDNNPGKTSKSDASTRNVNFIVGREDNTDIIFPDKNVNFTYRKNEANQSVNPLQFLDDDNDNKIYCEIDVDFKNNKFDGLKKGTNQIKDYCYSGNEADINIMYHRDQGLTNENKIYPIHGIEYCPKVGGEEKCQAIFNQGKEIAKSSDDNTFRFNKNYKDYWDTKCSRYMERYPFTGFYTHTDVGFHRSNVQQILNIRRLREYKIVTMNETKNIHKTDENIAINIKEVSFGNPYYTNQEGEKIAFPFKIQPGLEFGIDKNITIYDNKQYIEFKKWKRNEKWEKDYRFYTESQKEIEIEYMQHLYYSIKNESLVSKYDKNTNKNEILFYPKKHPLASRIFVNKNDKSEHYNTDRDNDGQKIIKGEISINDINDSETDITYKILENILIKYLFPIGSKVSVKSSQVSVPEIKDYTGWISPGFYCLGVVSNNKGDHLGKLNLQISNIRGNQDQTYITKNIINTKIPVSTELFIVKGIFTFPEPVNKSICDTFKLSYSRSNLQHNTAKDFFTFGTSDLHKYHNMDIGSEDLIKDLYFASSHYDKKSCFAVGEVFNQGRYGISKENLEIKKDDDNYPIKRSDNEIDRKSFSVEPHLNQYKGLHNLEKDGDEIRNSTWGSAICGITNHDTSYYPHNNKLHQTMKKFCPLDYQGKKDIQESRKENGCSVKDFTKLSWPKSNKNARQFHNEIDSGQEQVTNMPFKEGLFFKHDVNDIKNRYVTTFIGDENKSINIDKLLKYNHEIKNKYWGTITQKERKVRTTTPPAKGISIFYFIIPLIIIVCIILFFVRKK